MAPAALGTGKTATTITYIFQVQNPNKCVRPIIVVHVELTIYYVTPYNSVSETDRNLKVPTLEMWLNVRAVYSSYLNCTSVHDWTW